ncbi:retinoid-inducible serine carboxypeptidase [Microplitis demolitor]|uniref:retinoid-inducible serine carboxypeptidase n=1 Tax=Microplitis demolitor TaxID=69319 RepID=UPI0004CD313F|nr:retinoid-inducible serine carboxypeptidase [Microplitis demolitor]
MPWIWITIFISSLFACDKVNKVEGKKGFGPGEQNWGYVTVRPGAHMFWWLYYVNPPDKPTNFDPLSKPLIIWIHGGPGGSGTGYGNFKQFGPLDIHGHYRNYTWVNDYNVLFIDNPVGSGFSYVDSYSDYAKNNTQIANDLFECIKKFFQVIPAFRNIFTYIASESYGAKMGAELASIWYKAQNSKSIQSDLKGIVLGAPWISPIDSILSWPSFLLNTGIVNTAGYEKIKGETEKVRQAIEAKKWREATDAKNGALKIVNEVSDYIPTSNILIEKKSYDGVQNYTTRFPKPQKPDENLAQLIHFMNNDVKKTLGLISPWVLNPPEVVENIYEDIMKPVVNTVEELLNETNLKVSVYAGQLDLFVALPGTVKWVENLKWKHEDAWKRAPRVAFAVDNIIEGYVQACDKLKMYWVLRAGHLVVEDNPYAINAILQEMTSVKYNP